MDEGMDQFFHAMFQVGIQAARLPLPLALLGLFDSPAWPVRTV